MTLTIETDNKDIILQLLTEAMENPERSNIDLQKLKNGDYYLNIVRGTIEPPIKEETTS